MHHLFIVKTTVLIPTKETIDSPIRSHVRTESPIDNLYQDIRDMYIYVTRRNVVEVDSHCSPSPAWLRLTEVPSKVFQTNITSSDDLLSPCPLVAENLECDVRGVQVDSFNSSTQSNRVRDP